MHMHSTIKTFLFVGALSGLSPAQELPSASPAQIAQYPSAPFEDSKGNLWFSSVQKGFIRYDGKTFTSFTTDEGLASNLVRGVVEDDAGILWIATSCGVSRYDGKSFTTLTDYGDLDVTFGYTEKGNHRDVWKIIIDREGTLWTTSLDGVFRYDGESFSPFPLPVTAKAGAFEFTPKMVYTIYEDPEGAMWFGTDGAGAVRYDGTEMTVFTEEANGLCSDRVCRILKDSRGVLWFGTSSGGISRFTEGKFTTHLRSKTRSKHTGWGRYMAIHEDRKGDVWIGAAMSGGGVYCYDGETFHHYSAEDGLGEGGVASIREDRSGTLWFGSTSGVFRFDGERFINFTRKDAKRSPD